ncbi:MAG: hypothetical protein AAFZ18_22500 [Myxococcota bacterium]
MSTEDDRAQSLLADPADADTLEELKAKLEHGVPKQIVGLLKEANGMRGDLSYCLLPGFYLLSARLLIRNQREACEILEEGSSRLHLDETGDPGPVVGGFTVFAASSTGAQLLVRSSTEDIPVIDGEDVCILRFDRGVRRIASTIEEVVGMAIVEYRTQRARFEPGMGLFADVGSEFG